MKKEKKLSEKPIVYADVSPFLPLACTLTMAKSMRNELRQWNNGGALKHLGPDEIARILTRSEAVITLMIQELELNVDDGK
jgi:hypothetical protein